MTEPVEICNTVYPYEFAACADAICTEPVGPNAENDGIPVHVHRGIGTNSIICRWE